MLESFNPEPREVKVVATEAISRGRKRPVPKAVPRQATRRAAPRPAPKGAPRRSPMPAPRRETQKPVSRPAPKPIQRLVKSTIPEQDKNQGQKIEEPIRSSKVDPKDYYKEKKTAPWYDPSAMRCEVSRNVSSDLYNTVLKEKYHAEEASGHIGSIGVSEYGPKWNKAEELQKFKNACKVGKEAASALNAAELMTQKACGEKPKTTKIILDQEQENIRKLNAVCKNKPN